MTNPLLPIWAAIVAQPVLGRVGHHRTQEPGPAHPARPAPAWVTARGVSLARLHAAFCATVTHERGRGAAECGAGPVRRLQLRVASAKGKVVPMRRRA